VKIPRRTAPFGNPRKEPDSAAAAEDTARLADQAVAALAGAAGVNWYREAGSEVDRAALTLCRLRRARAGLRGGPEYGDEAVRAALAESDPEAVVWLASRAVSYMDESGYPEAVEPWFQELLDPRG
jgi:hypothetical protein